MQKQTQINALQKQFKLNNKFRNNAHAETIQKQIQNKFRNKATPTQRRPAVTQSLPPVVNAGAGDP
jgi:hypothetical protein